MKDCWAWSPLQRRTTVVITNSKVIPHVQCHQVERAAPLSEFNHNHFKKVYYSPYTVFFPKATQDKFKCICDSFSPLGRTAEPSSTGSLAPRRPAIGTQATWIPSILESSAFSTFPYKSWTQLPTWSPWAPLSICIQKCVASEKHMVSLCERPAPKNNIVIKILKPGHPYFP